VDVSPFRAIFYAVCPAPHELHVGEAGKLVVCIPVEVSAPDYVVAVRS
jgi:hypothetical protein